ncbi:MAG TPA: SpoIIE family protein phosphatase, partial [Candidatus Ozemobacteraceae bacterium]|nr:SpoIIE family protein phosphatase [Candidatus Ozemobacteraceae bacterium]
SDSTLKQLRQIVPLNLLSSNRYALLFPLIRLHNRVADYMIVFLWNFRTSVRLFLDAALLPANRRESGLRLVIHENATGSFFSSGFKLSANLKQFLQRVNSRDHLFSSVLTLPEGRYLAAGLPAQNLSGFTLCILFPYDRIRGQLSQTRFWLNFLLSVNLLLSLVLSVLIARRFLGPVARLSQAIMLTQRNRSQERVEELAADELGQLAQAFNSALDNFEELNLGRIVQEQLFPVESLDNGGFRLFGRSVAMTDLGGDFFDLIRLDDRRTAIIFGDVAGHGVPAALVMAMAKAFFHERPAETFLATKLLGEFSALLYSLKSGTSRRMMTMMIAILDSGSGRVDIVNAGQTFPLLVNGDAGTARFLEIPGAPAGTLKKLRLGEATTTLEPGDTLVLYTDG